MADSGEDRSSSSGVRLRGFAKKDTAAPPAVKAPDKAGSSEVRFRRRTPAPAAAASESAVESAPAERAPYIEVEEIEPTAEVAGPAVEEIESAAEVVEPQEAAAAQGAGPAVEEIESAAEVAGLEEASAAAEAVGPAVEEIESAADVAGPAVEEIESAAGVAKPQEASAPGPSVQAATVNPAIVKQGVRLRFPAKREAAPVAEAKPLESQELRPAYTSDNDLDRVQRRQWWKYHLRVKSGRQKGEEQNG